jgi:hypothetical protein
MFIFMLPNYLFITRDSIVTGGRESYNHYIAYFTRIMHPAFWHCMVTGARVSLDSEAIIILYFVV